MHIVVQGNPVDGFTFTGPFTTGEDAIEWGEDNGDGDWWITKLEAKEE